MVAYAPRNSLIVPIAPSIGGLAGLGFALIVALMPGHLLDSLVSASKLPAVLAVAAAPLGATARAVLVLVGGGGIAFFASVALYLLVGHRAVRIGARPDGSALASGEAEVPLLRRADAHPDAPARRPLFATQELGAPLLGETEAAVDGKDVPADLDQPLAAFDPTAIPESPREPVRALASLARPQLIDPGDRIATFDPTDLMDEDALPVLQRSATEIAAETGASIHALLDRLERGASRRERPPVQVLAGASLTGPARIQAALGSLRSATAG